MDASNIVALATALIAAALTVWQALRSWRQENARAASTHAAAADAARIAAHSPGWEAYAAKLETRIEKVEEKFEAQTVVVDSAIDWIIRAVQTWGKDPYPPAIPPELAAHVPSALHRRD